MEFGITLPTDFTHIMIVLPCIKCNLVHQLLTNGGLAIFFQRLSIVPTEY